MKYTEYDIDDFLTDEFFIQWVKQPNENNRHFWRRWLEQHPEKRSVVMAAVSIINSVHYKERAVMEDSRYVEIFENILKADKDLKVSEGKQWNWHFSFSWRRVAASILILYSVGLVYQTIQTQSDSSGSSLQETVIIKKSTPAGKKSIVTLMDGTTIYLNAESEINYASAFSDSLRWVSLKGEAFFEVAQEARPFVVEIGQTRVRVLGTSFNINQRQNGVLTVALVSGKVSINDQQGNQIELSPSQMMVREEDGRMRKTTFDPLEVTGWKDKVLVFRKSSLTEVKQKVEIWFGVKVELRGKLDRDWSYSG